MVHDIVHFSKFADSDKPDQNSLFLSHLCIATFRHTAGEPQVDDVAGSYTHRAPTRYTRLYTVLIGRVKLNFATFCQELKLYH